MPLASKGQNLVQWDQNAKSFSTTSYKKQIVLVPHVETVGGGGGRGGQGTGKVISFRQLNSFTNSALWPSG